MICQYSLVGAFITNYDIKYMVNTLGSESFVTYWAGLDSQGMRDCPIMHSFTMNGLCWLSPGMVPYVHKLAVWW